MWSAIKNCWGIPELRKRILFTAGIIILARMASSIPCPGIDSMALRSYMANSLNSSPVGNMLSMISMFSGGAIEKFSLAALGIMPYITASIIIQLMTPVLPQLEKLQREGEPGRQKIQQYTRYFTLLICLVQGLFAAFAILDPTKIGLPSTGGTSLVLNVFAPGSALTSFSMGAFVVLAVLVLTAGTMILVWLGDRIQEKGIGNGASIIITIGILARFPSACMELFEQFRFGSVNAVQIFLYILMFGIVSAFAVLLTQGTRQIPIQMARKMMGTGRAATGTSTFLPLKVNYAGIMPIIFGSALLQIPTMGLQFLSPHVNTEASWFHFCTEIFRHGSTGNMVVYGLMIVIFSYFWVANMFNPMKVSDYLKRDGAYIPGIRPGQPTAHFLDGTMTRLTFAGAIMLTALAVLPMVLSNVFAMPFNIASFFGGTSLLIAVGVTLDTLNQMESHLVMRNYDGFLKHGRLRGRNPNFKM